MDSKEYKKYHEEHMMHNTGTTVEECLILLSTVPLCICLSLWLSSHISKSRMYIFEFCVIVLPVLFNCTVLSHVNHIVFLNLFLIFTTLSLLKLDVGNIKRLLNFEVPPRKGFITNYRASTNFISVLCILAVDFTVFPKRFAKTESFGFGFMDLGVGFFICSNGLVEKHEKSHNQLSKLLKTVSVMCFLGLTRVITVKSIDYHEHVLEYGVHWNFFFTLALCQLMSFIVKYVTNYKDPIWLTLITGFIHQMLLFSGFQEWVLSDTPRDSFLSANREGLISCLGYVSLYFASTAIGKFISGSKHLTYKNLLLKLLIMCLLCWLGTAICCKTILVSRRLVNLGYIFWILSLTLTELILLIIAELGFLGMQNGKVFSGCSMVPILLESINRNGLVFFLLGNLLTGLINILFQTLLLGKAMSMTLIIVYKVVLCAVTYILFIKNITLKF